MHRTVALEQEQNPIENDDRRGYSIALVSVLAAAQRLQDWAAEDERLAGINARLGNETHGTFLKRTILSARLAALRGRSEEAQALLKKAVESCGPADGGWRVQAITTAALDDRLQRRTREALVRMEQVAADPAIEGLPVKIQSDVAAELGTDRLELGDFAQAEPDLRRCRELFIRGQVAPSISVNICLVGAARLALHAGRPGEAEELLSPLAASWERLNPDGAARGEVLHWLAQAERGLGKSADARRDEALSEKLLRGTSVPALHRLADRRVAQR
jgi:hypothetical protein